MAGPWEEFAPQQSDNNGPWSEFAPSEKPKKQNKGLVADIGTDLKRGVQNIPSAITGLADIPVAAVTGSPLISAAAEGLGKMTGFQPGQWAKDAEQEYSEGRKQARQNIDAAWKDGTAGDIASAYLQNPSQIVGSIAESLPSMLVGGLAGRAALGIGGRAVSAGAGGVGPALPGAIARTVGEKLAPAVGAGLGEGAVMAGQAMDNLTEQGVDPRTAAGYAAGTGLVGAALGAGGGKVAQMLGVVDPETAIAGGAARAIREGASASKWQVAKETGKNIIGGGISEGIFEELPQSVMEQGLSNLAQGKPIGEGVARAGVDGALAGFGMGAGFNAIPARQEPQGPLSRTVEAGKQSGAIQEQPLALGYNANVRTDGEPLYTYPDGSTLTQSEYEQRQAAEEKQRLDGMIQDAPLTRMAERAQERAAETAPDRDLANLIAEEKNRLDPVRAGLASVALERQQARQEKQSARSQQGNGSFSNMNEFADLLNSERQQVESSRRSIAAKQALRRESDLESADARVADSMAKESEQKRRNVLESVLSDPAVQNHAAKFSAELKRQGFRNATPTESELSSIVRFGDILNAKPETTTEPSLPNEATAEQLGIKERKEPSQAQGSQRDKIAEVQQLVSAGWKANGRTLVSPTGKKRNLNFAERYAAVKAQQEKRGNVAPIEQVAQEATQANDEETRTQPAAAPETKGLTLNTANSESTVALNEAPKQVGQTPVPTKPRAVKKAGPQNRDDLVGAILRVTGNKGISAGMAQTITGDKAGSGNAKLRGLFTNDGIADLDDTAELLRTEEGYDVRDGNHLAELIREQSAGNAVYSMERVEREAQENAEKEYKASVNQKATELGLKKVGGKRTLQVVEAEISKVEAERNAMEAAEERAAIQAESIFSEPQEMSEAEIMAWLSQDLAGTYTQEEIDRAEQERTDRANAKAEANAIADSEGQAESRAGERAQDGATEAGARSTESLTEPTDDIISRAKALGMKTVGVSAEKLTKQVEEAEARANGSSSARGDAGSALTKEQRKSVLKTLVDVYRKNNAPKEFKGIDNNGNERSGYAYSPEYFVRSDITGAMVRYYVTLPDGRIAHPTELFADYTQSDIDAALQKEIDAARKQEDGDKSRLESLKRRIGETLNVANRKYNAANPNRDDTVPAILTDGNVFIRTAPENVANDLRLLGKGWKEQKPESFNLSKQTNEQAAAEYKRQQEEANKKEAEPPAKNVTVDQVDMFNEQGGLRFSKAVQQFDEGKLTKASFEEGENRFETGVPVTFKYLHNKQSATKLFGIPDKDSPYDRGYEPSGKYVTITEGDRFAADNQTQFESGVLTFENPLVLSDKNWKRELSAAFGGLTGKRLSQAVIAAGYDGVVTIGKYGTSETLDLTSFDARKAKYSKLSDAPAGEELIVIHNLSAGNLLYADDIGGIPVPSVGITKASSPFTGFGEITLIASSDMIDPERGVPVFDRDAYTARFPSMNYKKVPSKKADTFYERMKPVLQYGEDGKSFMQQLWDAMTGSSASPDKVSEEFQRYLAPQMMYAKEVLGKEIRVPMKLIEPEHPFTFQKTWIDFVKANKKDYNDDDFNRRAGLAAKKAMTEYVESKMTDDVVGNESLRKAFSRYIDRYIGEDGSMNWNVLDKAYEQAGMKGKKRIDTFELSQRVDKVVGRNDPAYLKWITSQTEGLFNPPTITLRGREVEPTLDNIVEAMTTGGVQGAEKTMTFGGGKTAAMLGKRFKSIAEIKAARDQVVSSERHDEMKKSAEKTVEAYRLKAVEFFTQKDWRGNIDTWAGMDSAMEALAKAGKMSLTDGQIKAALSSKGFRGVSDEVVNLARESIVAIRSAATDYFEAKPQRAVSLKEFKGAVVPKGTDPDVIAALERSGLQVVEYNSNKPEDRAAKVGKLAKTLNKVNKNVLFSSSGKPIESDALPQQTAERLIASELGSTTLAKVLVDSGIVSFANSEEELKKLGGKLMVAWHGSPHDHDGFTTAKIGTGEGAQAYGWGLYFASSKGVAEWYRENLTRNAFKVTEKQFIEAIAERFPSDNKIGKAARTSANLYSLGFKIGLRGNADAIRLGVLKSIADEAVSLGVAIDDIYNHGKLYQVELAPSEDEYLDWDKPLSEQSEKVKAALAKSDLNVQNGLDGHELYKFISNKFADDAGEGTSKSYYKESRWDRAASDYLHSIGIRGIRYLDGTSRGAGEGSSNYVIFSDEDVSITAKYAKQQQILGATLPDGRIILNLGALTEQNFAGVLLHEGFHSTIKQLVGDETYAKLMKQLENMLKMGRGAQWVKDANAAVPKDTAPENVTEEIAAYAIEQHKNGGKIPSVLQRWVQSFLSAIRTAIIQRMPSGKLKLWAVKNIQPQDLANLAIAGLKAKAAGQVQAQGREAMAYSTAFGKDSQHRTPLGDATEIEVDGIKRPALNSNGKPIHWSREVVENFWRWFGDSKVVDAEGRPLVVYHGTAKDFTKFDLSKSGESTGNTGFYGAGAYFSEDGEDAGGYALWARKDEDDAANVIPAYLSLKDPLYLHINPKDDARKDKARASLGRIVDQLLSEGYFGKNPDKNEAGSLYSRLTTFVEKADFERFMGTLYNELKGGEGVSNLARRAGFDGVMAEGFKRGENFLAEAVAFDPTQIKSATGNTGDFGSTNPDIRYSKASQAIKSAVGAVTGADSKIVGASSRQYDQAQRQFFKNVGRDVERKNVIGRTLDYLRSDFWKKMAVGIVDQFRGLRDLGDNGQAYLLARLSKGTAGAFDALLNHGKLSIRDGVYDADTSGGFLQRLGVTLNGEIDDFLWWTAANRAEKLSQEDRENLFTPQDISAGKSLATGTTAFDYTVQTGPLKGKVTRNRAVIYADANRVFNEFQKNALDMAEQSGLIDGSTRHLWESEFYVPFYRVSDEDGEFVGAKMGNALVRQQAFKKLKGGTDKLNADLLANTLMNWSHLIEASAKNRAAKASLEAAGKMGAAQRVAATMGEYAKSNGSMLPPGTKGAVWYMDGGKKIEYLVSDPFVMTAITSLEYAGMRNAVMDVMSKFKHYLTIGVTANPAFKIRNLIRDSIQAIGTSDLGYNPITNIKEGIRTTRRDSQEYVSALASGGLIRFGTMLENSEADRVRQLIKSGVKDSTILNDENKLRAFYDQYLEPAVAAYNELGNRSEEINRAALYNQLIKQGKSHAEAALLARDLMDFSLQGSFTTIRFLSQVVPFFNARLQGMYKLGRATKENPAKLATVIGACAVASIALMLGYDDDEDWKRREDFDRDGYWWFKFGGLEWRIPKPFEVGAVASLAERTLEYMINDEMTGERFRKVVGDLVKNNLSMNPVPQVIKPIIDLYANKDSFTGRPIETMNMQRLEPEMRFNSQTSLVARGLSATTMGALSPVQYDHIARAYFGWLGSFAVGMGDMAARSMSDEPEKPTADYYKLGSFGFAKEAGTGSSRYVSMIYDQAKELEQAHATYRQLVKDGKMGEAQEYMEDNKDKLSRYRSTEAVKKAESRLNEQIRLVEKSNLSADEKRERINAINKQKEQVAMRLAPGLN